MTDESNLGSHKCLITVLLRGTPISYDQRMPILLTHSNIATQSTNVGTTRIALDNDYSLEIPLKMLRTLFIVTLGRTMQ